MNVKEVKRQITSPPAPNPMGKDRMRIVQRSYASVSSSTGGPPTTLETVTFGAWEIF